MVVGNVCASSAGVGQKGLDFSLAILMVVWMGIKGRNGNLEERERDRRLEKKRL